ncbi:ABC transporter permease [Enterococcus nangangensis]|uniref:ABC transporter permease n=1 Tax=Enterococcus nangangensis TaxID=2559926 RepID=UPI0010F4CC77|nr:ABC transporter permease [Enterococcus nangangensis]
MNGVQMLHLIITSALVYSTPLVFTALGGTFSERSGVVNVGLEGIMVMGAFSAVVFNLSFYDAFGKLTPWLGILVGGVVGVLFSLIHAVATINLRADHIISGTVINLMAPALGVFLVKAIYNKGQTDNIKGNLGYFTVPGLEKIPVIGPILFKNTYLPAYLAIVVAVLAWFIIFKTRFGLRLRAVGENPQAADTLGINVYAMKYSGVLISGLLGGFGGAVFAQTISGNFSVGTIVGQGFISMAAMIFGKWNPLGAMGGAFFFGFAQSLSIIGAQLPVISSVPSVYLQIAPYLLTIIVLVLFLGKASGPKANGVNYIKSK